MIYTANLSKNESNGVRILKIGELVSFHQENFFEGAVQLRWVTERPAQAEQAAKAFVFHGPRYHGAGKAETEGIDKDYVLKDSVSFVNDLLTSLVGGINGEDHNPYWMVVAGYGSGKSHLALTCASLLGDPSGELASHILQNIQQADTDLSLEIKQQLHTLARPALVLSLDGMSGFHLGNTLSQSALAQLQHYGADTGAVRALSPRFQVAEQFVERNYEFRASQFEQYLPNLSKEKICEALQKNEESIYNLVDSIYEEANGSPIPVQGQESAQELLKTLCEVYCGDDGLFSSVVILFDEFGRYLEYAADKPRLAGDAALQQLFQGVQDYGNKIRFIGFIQYELKAYLQRFSSTDLRQLQRYITRFDSAQKWYLSTNLETLFAHMIRKQQHELTQLWDSTESSQRSQETWQLISRVLPAYQRFPVWNEADQFSRVIAQGCWPLHPLATWFLTRQKDIVQSRSALTFIKETLEQAAGEDAQQNGHLKQISVAELVLQHMLPEMIAAERETGTMVAETLQLLLEKFQGHLSPSQRLLLVSIAVLEKMRIGRQEQQTVQRLLAQASALPLSELTLALGELSNRFGVLEWNTDLGQYEFVIDASTRGQFEQWTRRALGHIDAQTIKKLFLLKGASESGLGDLLTDFGPRHDISTPDWFYQASFTHSDFLKNTIKDAFKAWMEAIAPNDPKGQIIYLYLHPTEDLDTTSEQLLEIFQEQLEYHKVLQAPIWVVGLLDTDSSIAEHFARIDLFENKLDSQEKEKFRRFIPDELQRSRSMLHSLMADAVKQRISWVAGIDDLAQSRMKIVGERIFKEIYPNAVSFSFDGFTSAAGAGGGDVSTLTRNLMIQGVSASWVHAQPKRLQNRANQLLANKWKSLSPKGDLSPPHNPAVKLVYDKMLASHQNDPQRSLLNTFHMLVKPPYGMNNASAGVLIGLIIGNKVPAKRIQYQQKIIAATDWVNLVFSNKRGQQHTLDQSILAETRISFPSENAEQQWRTLLQNWEMATEYTKILTFADDAALNNKQEPIPEILEGQYRYLMDNADRVMLKIGEVKKKIDKIELSMERSVKEENTQFLIKSGSDCLALLSRFDNESPCWSTETIDQVSELADITKQLIAQRLDDWILRQSCHNVLELEKFRHRTQGAIKGLNDLGFSAGAKQLESHVQRSIVQVEARQKFSMTLAKCDDYPRQPIPPDSTPVFQLRSEVATGDSLIESLSKAQSVLSIDEIQAYTRSINGRQKKLRNVIKGHTDAFSLLYNAQFSTLSDLTDTLEQAHRLSSVFVGTRDADELDDMTQQLEYIIQDINTWQQDDISADLVQGILQTKIEGQLTAFDQFLEEKETDEIWDISLAYQQLANEYIAFAKKRSRDWVRKNIKLPLPVNQLDKKSCRFKIKELSDSPHYLSGNDKDKVDELLINLRNRIHDIDEVSRSEKITIWQTPLLEIKDVSKLSQDEVEYYLNILDTPPPKILPQELQALQPLKKMLTSHLDELSMSDILRRIWALPVVKIREVFSAIASHLKSHDK